MLYSIMVQQTKIVSLEGFKNAKTGETVIDKKTGELNSAILIMCCLKNVLEEIVPDNIFSAPSPC